MRDFADWLNDRLSQEEEDPDLRMIECSLIRSMSEYRKLQISEVRLSEDFDRKFLKALENEKNFSLSTEPNPFWNYKVLRYALAVLVLGGVVGLVTFLGLDRTFISFSSSTAASMKVDPDVFQELREEFQLIQNIRNSDDIDSLRVLEKYNLTNGITDRATRIHYTIELLSK